jgi:hypothetical protein
LVTRSLEQRFWEKVDVSSGADGCWPWTGARDYKGYGRIGVGDGHQIKPHRLAYELATGRKIGELQIDHRCHNRGCCNPAHLRLATDKQNKENHSGPQRNSKSGIRGVSPKGNRWRVQVKHNRKTIHVGYFATLEAAEAAVIAKRNELHTRNDADRKGEMALTSKDAAS